MARILIVEDDLFVATSMSELLEGAGHHVLGIADNEASAVKQAAHGRPDLARWSCSGERFGVLRNLQKRVRIANYDLSEKRDQVDERK